jgi:hypothetical protein
MSQRAVSVTNEAVPHPPLSPYAEFGLRVAERFGVPTVLLLAVAWWVKADIVQPLLDAHFDVVGKIVAGQREQNERLNLIGGKLEELIQVSRHAAQAPAAK